MKDTAMNFISPSAIECHQYDQPTFTQAQELPHSHISLKQWNTLLAVVRSGSFAKAGEVLHISQPAISYTIAKIEERLGIPIMHQDGRRARITEIGQQLLVHVEPLLQQAAQIEIIAKQLRANWRPAIRLAVVDDFPIPLLLSGIRRYSDSHTGATVLLTKGTTDTVHQLLHSREAALVITQGLAPGMRGDLLVEAEYVPVAHAEHPLFALGRALTDSDFQHAIEIKVDNAKIGHADTACVVTSRNKHWNVSNIDTAEKALMEGIGYGWLPRHQVQAALTAGRLALLPIATVERRIVHFYIGYRKSEKPSDEVHRFIGSLRAVIDATSASDQFSFCDPLTVDKVA
jgi:DNA-binding transcriptional LysR family regulator